MTQRKKSAPQPVERFVSSLVSRSDALTNALQTGWNSNPDEPRRSRHYETERERLREAYSNLVLAQPDSEAYQECRASIDDIEERLEAIRNDDDECKLGEPMVPATELIGQPSLRRGSMPQLPAIQTKLSTHTLSTPLSANDFTMLPNAQARVSSAAIQSSTLDKTLHTSKDLAQKFPASSAEIVEILPQSSSSNSIDNSLPLDALNTAYKEQQDSVRSEHDDTTQSITPTNMTGPDSDDNTSATTIVRRPPSWESEEQQSEKHIAHAESAIQSIDFVSAPLARSETSFVGNILKDLKQTAFFCEHLSFSIISANDARTMLVDDKILPAKIRATASDKKRLLLLTDFRIVAIRKRKLGLVVRYNVCIVDITDIAVLDENSIIVIRFGVDKDVLLLQDGTQPKVKAFIALLLTRLHTVKHGYPDSERAHITLSPSYHHSLSLSPQKNIEKKFAILHTYAALCDRFNVTDKHRFPLYIDEFLEGTKGQSLDVSRALAQVNKQRKISLAGVQALVGALRYNIPHLDKLWAANIRLRDDGIDALADIITSDSKLTSLCLSNTNLTSKACKSVNRILHIVSLNQPSNSLHYLNLSQNALGDAGIVILCRGLNSLNVTELVLANCGIGEAGFATLSVLLMKPSWTNADTGLRVLNVSDNSPGVSGLAVIASYLSATHNLRQLILMQCSPSTGFVRADITPVIAALRANNLIAFKRLTVLDVSHNRLSDAAFIDLSAIISTSTALKTLYIVSTRLKSTQLGTLFNAIQSRAQTLQPLILDIAENDLEESLTTALVQLAFAKESNETAPNDDDGDGDGGDDGGEHCLLALNIASCRMSSTALSSVLVHLPLIWRSLQVLVLDGNFPSGMFHREATAKLGSNIASLLSSSQLPSLSVLSINGCDGMHLGSSVIGVFVALRDNTSLKCLKARNNAMPLNAYDALVSSLDTNTTLTYLDVDANRCSLSALNLLSDSIEHNRTLIQAIPFEDLYRCIANDSTFEEVESMQAAMLERINANRNALSSKQLNEYEQLCDIFTRYPYDSMSGRSPSSHTSSSSSSSLLAAIPISDKRKIIGINLEDLALTHISGYGHSLPTPLVELGEALHVCGGRVTKKIFSEAPRRNMAVRTLTLLRCHRLEEATDPIAIAYLIKSILYSLPKRLLSFITLEDLHRFNSVTIDSSSEKTTIMVKEELHILRKRMSRLSRAVYDWLLALLADFSNATELNCMNPASFGKEFVPVLFSMCALDDNNSNEFFAASRFLEHSIRRAMLLQHAQHNHV